MATRQRQKPEKVFRSGNISVSVWVQTVGEGDDAREFRTVSVQRSYLDDDDKRQYTSNFSMADLPVVQRLLQVGLEYIESKEVEVVG